LFDPVDGRRTVRRVTLDRANLAEQPHAKGASKGRAEIRGTTPCKGDARRAAQSLRNNPMQRGPGKNPWNNPMQRRATAMANVEQPLEVPIGPAFARPVGGIKTLLGI
jgi:hypothetical protein